MMHPKNSPAVTCLPSMCVTLLLFPGSEYLRAEEVDLYAAWNKRNHHCADYETEEMVIRRGQGFVISIILNRPYNQSTDTVSLVLAVGEFSSKKC